jgi:hypothetical protein
MVRYRGQSDIGMRVDSGLSAQLCSLGILFRAVIDESVMVADDYCSA